LHKYFIPIPISPSLNPSLRAKLQPIFPLEFALRFVHQLATTIKDSSDITIVSNGVQFNSWYSILNNMLCLILELNNSRQHLFGSWV
jgi:hypothetical protein